MSSKSGFTPLPMLNRPASWREDDPVNCPMRFELEDPFCIGTRCSWFLVNGLDEPDENGHQVATGVCSIVTNALASLYGAWRDDDAQRCRS